MKKKILFVVCLLAGLFMANSGLDKFFHYMPMPTTEMTGNIATFMEGLTASMWMMPVIALVEISAGILIIFERTRALGAVIWFPVMTGILLTNIFLLPSTLVMSIPLYAINIWIIVENRDKYMPMIRA